MVADGDGDEIVEIEIDRRSLGVWFLEVIAVIEVLRLFMEFINYQSGSLYTSSTLSFQS